MRYLLNTRWQALLVLFLLFCSFSGVEAQEESSCMRSWAESFDTVDEHFNIMLDDIFDSPASIYLTGADAAAALQSAAGSYSCNLDYICSTVRAVAGNDLVPSSVSAEQDYRLFVPPDCSGEIYVPAQADAYSNARTEATFFHVSQAFPATDNFASCSMVNRPLDERSQLWQDCQKVAAAKKQMMQGKFSAALQLSTERKKVGFIAARLTELESKISGISEQVEMSLSERTRNLFTRLDGVLKRISCRIPVTEQAR